MIALKIEAFFTRCLSIPDVVQTIIEIARGLNGRWLAKLVSGRYHEGRLVKTPISVALVIPILLPGISHGQTALTWQEVRERFEASNPTLRAAQLNIDESRAQEVTAYLRPNPGFSTGVDQV